MHFPLIIYFVFVRQNNLKMKNHDKSPTACFLSPKEVQEQIEGANVLTCSVGLASLTSFDGTFFKSRGQNIVSLRSRSVMKLFGAAVLGYAGVSTWNKLNFISKHFLNVFLMVFDYSSSPRAFFLLASLHLSFSYMKKKECKISVR